MTTRVTSKSAEANSSSPHDVLAFIERETTAAQLGVLIDKTRGGLILTFPTRRAPTAKKSNGAERRHAERGDLITGNRAGDLRRGSKKFVREAEQAISNEVEMKMLTGPNFSPAQ